MKLLALVVLALPMTVHAQLYEGNISRAFDKVANAKGLKVSVSQSTQRDDKGGHAEKTMIRNFAIGKHNFGLLNDVQKAFQQDYDDAATFYTCFSPMQDSYRQMWEVKMKQGGNYRIGNKPNSSYAIATFDDEARPGFRTVYAAEWWDTDDPNIKEGVLLSTYGEKPAMAAHLPQSGFDRIIRTPLEVADSILAKVSADSVFANVHTDFPDISEYFNGNSLLATGIQPANIPMGKGGQDEWMSKAIDNIGHLSNGDWHRVFGLITQKMMDRAQKESAEDLVVAAGIVLDLCKHADQLDEDERKVSANRLLNIAEHYFDTDRFQYIHDLLMLGAKNLEKK